MIFKPPPPSLMVLRDKNLLKFSPFLDDSNMIRVGGRLSKSSLPYEVKHPVLISDKHPLAKLIVSHFHKLSKHLGPTSHLRTYSQ